MGRIIFFCLLCVTGVAASGNKTGDSVLHLQLERMIPGNYTNFYADNLGNIFFISPGNQVKKLTANYDSAGVFNDVRRYGDVYLLDVNNPLKVLVYYKDFTTILILDRFLSQRNIIDLRQSGILQAKAVAHSYDNNYWVFDELDNTIKKIDDNGNILTKFPDFRVLFSDNYNPSRIIDVDGQLYLYDEKNGWLIFDYYGAFKRRIEWPGKKDVQVIGTALFGRDMEFIYSTNLRSFSDSKLQPEIKITDAGKVLMAANKLFVLRKEGLSVYRIMGGL